jgi:hypothetical protein
MVLIITAAVVAVLVLLAAMLLQTQVVLGVLEVLEPRLH